jgi:SAM-dependent methyltransferase
MPDKIVTVRDWYEESYTEGGFDAQRRYPNEEFLRFMGRNFFGIPLEKRKHIHILEIGCGSCANLWVIAREGFSAFGLDLSEEAIQLGHQMLKKWDVSANLKVSSMTAIPCGNASFDSVVDVFSTYCLDEDNFKACLQEVKRVLKPGGLFFSYTPGKASNAFQNHQPARMLDASTLEGIYRKDSPYAGNHYPFRFVSPAEYSELVTQAGLKIRYLETVHRSYFNQREVFEHVVLEAQKHEKNRGK